jgi:hypothetical protein
VIVGEGEGYTAALTQWRTAAGSVHTAAFAANTQYVARVTLTRVDVDAEHNFAFSTTWTASNVNGFRPAGVTLDAAIVTVAQNELVLDIKYPVTLPVPTVALSQTGINLAQVQTVRNVAWNVTYTLSGSHKFADQNTITTNKADFAVTGLPAGVTDSAITRVSDNVVTVYYRGTPSTKDGAGTLVFPPTVPVGNLSTASGAAVAVTAGSTVPATKTYEVKEKLPITTSYIVVDNAPAAYAIGQVRKVTPSIQSSFTSELTGDGGTVYFQVTYRKVDKDGDVVSGPATSDTGNVNIGVTDANTYYYSVKAFNKYREGTRTGTFTVNRRDISSSGMTLTATTAGTLTYTGSALDENVTVVAKDGNMILEEGTDWLGTTAKAGATGDKTAFKDAVNAGASTVEIEGTGNYSGKRSVTFNINKQRVYIDTVSMTALAKAYNGVSALDTAALGNFVKFSKTAVPETGSEVTLVHGTDYTVVGNFVNAAGANVVDSVPANRVKFTVTLVNDGTTSKNFTLSSSATATNGGSADAFKSAKINRAAPDTLHFNYTKPSSLTHAFTGQKRGIGAVTLKAPFTGMGLPFRVLYASDTTTPSAAGTYPVTVSVDSLGANFKAGTVSLGDYVISAPAQPKIADTWKTDTTRRQGLPLTLTVDATPAATGDVLTYQWFRDGVQIAGATAKSLTPSGLLQGNSYIFRVVVTNTKNTTQGKEVGTDERTVTVTIIDPPINLASVGAVVAALGTYTYNGGAIELPEDSVIVSLPPAAGSEADTVKLTRGLDYKVSYQNNTNVGTATVLVEGLDVYNGMKTATFKIEKKTPDFADLAVSSIEKTFDGKADSVKVTAAVGKGLGAVTVKYDNKTEVPSDAGMYLLSVDIAEGTNYTAVQNLSIGFYTVNRKDPVAGDFNGVAIPKEDKYTGEAQGLGEVTLKTGAEGSAGELTVLYNNVEIAPVEVGDYEVTLRVEGGTNYLPASIPLGTYTIHDTDWVKVASADRVIPKPVVTEEAAVAPVAKVSASFTAGPSPVSKASGKVTFFSSKQVKQGGLYVFDASGNVVAKIAAKAGTGAIGSWNLKDNKGAAVADGSYVVKGVLIGKDGTREKVSFVFAVVR